MPRVRSQDNALARLLASVPRPVYALDAQRTVIYCNAACADLLGLAAEDLIGQRADYRATSSGVGAAEIAASLCPPPEVFSGKALTAEVALLRASGTLRHCHVAFQPLADDALHGAGVLAFVLEREPSASGRGAENAEAADLHYRLSVLCRDVLANNPVEELIGISPAIERVREQIEVASRGNVRVLIHGPSGSGREHVARLLHRRASPDTYGQLVPLCCPLLDAELLQTTITALARRADTACRDNHTDSRAARTAPTLLLLEVDQLVDEAQAELAGFLSLPGFELYSIATAEGSLITLAQQGRFRSDLAHALSTLTISLPPLAERREDIPLLCQFFLEQLNAEGGRQLSGFSAESLDELADYAWPDNIDELSDLVELACRRAAGPMVDRRDLPEQIRWAATAAAHPRQPDEPIDLEAFLGEIEKELIERAMRRCKGNKTKAAYLLGVSRARLHRRLDHFGIS